MISSILNIEKGKAVIPKLRFPQFENFWKEAKLGELGSFKGGGTPSTSNENYWKGSIPWISSSDILDNDLHNINIYRFITDVALNESAVKIIPRKSILLVSRVGVGKIAINEFPLCTSQDFSNFTPFNDESYYIGYYLMAKKNILLNFSQGTSIKGFTTSDLKTVIINIPSLLEQQKIASFLSAVDEKIQQLSRKKELLEEYKKGVMQQLFSGKLRFKDENGEDYPDWEEKKFGDIYTFYTTNSLSRENLNYDYGIVRNIHYGDIHTKFKTLFDINKELVPFINSSFDISKIKDECYCQEGDLVIADASEDYADIGKSIEIVNLQGEKIVGGLHTYLARPNKKKMHIGFSGYIVRSPDFRKQIMTIAQGSKVLSISTGRIGMVKMKIPVEAEQEKITIFLSTIDVKIENLIQQINKTQNFKKGLLQQMFI
ncbi:restriction endonuclease subunit S [Flavobacterium hungaricum]|uniref:Restriction endonuclease subunit S n=1 Tax=Flavobacterium hungaricum TaxID=2082725 RepID=A0ABR9TDF6_9FLAO|nr:restriction endonuclease subunit S [Flavobacterium hungaricum]MBE8723378.1 restriction endonuclease subunit S [Flavobacterium hungaricum]